MQYTANRSELQEGDTEMDVAKNKGPHQSEPADGAQQKEDARKKRVQTFVDKTEAFHEIDVYTFCRKTQHGDGQEFQVLAEGIQAAWTLAVETANRFGPYPTHQLTLVRKES